MVEIRINGELVTFDGNFRDAFIFTIDYLRDSEEPTLRQTYNEFKDYTDEDLIADGLLNRTSWKIKYERRVIRVYSLLAK